jgi:hypothetical protein
MSHKCPTCGAENEIVNQCHCDPNNMPTVTRSPLPWEADEIAVYAKHRDTMVRVADCFIPDEDVEKNADLKGIYGYYEHANAEFIVRAVNNHDELVRACQAAMAYLVEPPSYYMANREAAAEIIRAVLDKVKESA